MSTACIRFFGVPLTCTYDYEPGQQQTWTDPGYPAIAALESVKVGGVEILDMLTVDQREAIETLICEEREEQAAEAMYQARQDRLMEEGYP